MVRSAERLSALLDLALAQPGRQADIIRQIDTEFGQDRAVIVFDMAGFTRRAAEEGIVPALLAVRRFQLLARDCVEAYGGEVVKTDADNTFAVFVTIQAAHAAGEALLSVAPAGAGLGFGRILRLDGDLFGAEVNAASKLGEDVARAGQLLLTPAAAARLDRP